MPKDIKAQNTSALTAIYVGTLFAVAFVHWGLEEVFAISNVLGQQVLVVAAITSFGAVLSNFLPNSVKHRLVYWRRRNVLPGHRCRRICKKDPRLVGSDLEQRWPKLFLNGIEEGDQNAYWYKEIYHPVRNAPEVVQAHRSFLLFRDAMAGTCLLLLGLLAWTAISFSVPIPPVGTWSLVVLAGVALLLCQAARQSGERMVSNAVVVALNR